MSLAAKTFFQHGRL